MQKEIRWLPLLRGDPTSVLNYTGHSVLLPKLVWCIAFPSNNAPFLGVLSRISSRAWIERSNVEGEGMSYLQRESFLNRIYNTTVHDNGVHHNMRSLHWWLHRLQWEVKAPQGQ